MGGGIDAPRRDELLLVLYPHEVRDEVKMLRIRANGVLFPWVPQLRNPGSAFSSSPEGGQHETAHLDRTVVVACCKQVRGRMHDAVDGCAAGGGIQGS